MGERWRRSCVAVVLTGALLQQAVAGCAPQTSDGINDEQQSLQSNIERYLQNRDAFHTQIARMGQAIADLEPALADSEIEEFTKRVGEQPEVIDANDALEASALGLIQTANDSLKTATNGQELKALLTNPSPQSYAWPWGSDVEHQLLAGPDQMFEAAKALALEGAPQALVIGSLLLRYRHELHRYSRQHYSATDIVREIFVPYIPIAITTAALEFYAHSLETSRSSLQRPISPQDAQAMQAYAVFGPMLVAYDEDIYGAVQEYLFGTVTAKQLRARRVLYDAPSPCSLGGWMHQAFVALDAHRERPTEYRQHLEAQLYDTECASDSVLSELDSEAKVALLDAFHTVLLVHTLLANEFGTGADTIDRVELASRFADLTVDGAFTFFAVLGALSRRASHIENLGIMTQSLSQTVLRRFAISELTLMSLKQALPRVLAALGLGAQLVFTAAYWANHPPVTRGDKLVLLADAAQLLVYAGVMLGVLGVVWIPIGIMLLLVVSLVVAPWIDGHEQQRALAHLKQNTLLDIGYELQLARALSLATPGSLYGLRDLLSLSTAQIKRFTLMLSPFSLSHSALRGYQLTAQSCNLSPNTVESFMSYVAGADSTLSVDDNAGISAEQAYRFIQEAGAVLDQLEPFLMNTDQPCELIPERLHYAATSLGYDPRPLTRAADFLIQGG